ncbi:MAG: hypothetical protein ACRCSF_05065 [Mycobacteriaceae bacterium]
MGLARTLVISLLSCILAFSTASCFSERPLPDTTALGAEVDRIPAGTYAAVMVTTPAFETRNGTYLDNSWLVFVDSTMHPLGYLHQKGQFRSQVARFRDGIVFADRQHYSVVTAHGTTTYPHSGKVIGTISQSPHDLATGNAFLLLSGGVQEDGHYQTLGIEVQPDGTATPFSLNGYGGALGQCYGKSYVISTSSVEDYSPITKIQSRLQLLEILRVDGHIQYHTISEWESKSLSPYGNNLPMVCDPQTNSISAYIRGGNRPEPGEPWDAGFYRINLDNGTSEWNTLDQIDPNNPGYSILTDRHSAPFGANTSWPYNDGVRFINNDAEIVHLPHSSNLGQVQAHLENPDTQLMAAVAIGSEYQGLAFFDQRIIGEEISPANPYFLQFNPVTGATTQRIPAPQWLTELLDGGRFTVNDIAIIA